MDVLIVALGFAMGNVLPAAEQAQVTVLAGLAGLGGLMVVSALAERLRS